jgi:hypothetical protein
MKKKSIAKTRINYVDKKYKSLKTHFIFTCIYCIINKVTRVKCI